MEGFMRLKMQLVAVSLVTLLAAGASYAQITSNPLPEPIVKKGIAVEIKDLVRLPDTRGLHGDDDVSPSGWARVSYVRELPDGRRFANDSRGFLYLIDANNKPTVYANVGEAFPYGIYNRLESGFIGFVFHPDFARNGLFYTVHSEKGPGNPKKPDFIPPGYSLKDVTFENVITQWHAADPAANVFSGSRREGFRNAHRLSWDPTDGTMFASDIGMDNIEEINIVHNGGNYGWMKREGLFENGRWRGGALNELYPLPKEILDGSEKDGFIYPVAV